MATWMLPYPIGITTNHLYQGIGRGRHLTPAAMRWRDEVILIVRQSGARLPEGKLALIVHYWPPEDHRRHDATNLLKFTEDCLYAAFGVDDERDYRVECHRHERSATPRILVEVEPL